MTLRIIEVQQSILKKNAVLAQHLRETFARDGTLVVNLLSSPGSGKTTLLERTLVHFANHGTAVLVGDQATDNDALRLAPSGAPVRQITTGAECRLDAGMVTDALQAWHLDPPPRLLFIENVGNLICPAEYDLGEDLRVALFSVTEGEDKPLKYPLAFATSHVVLITKTDLAPHTAFNRDLALKSIDCVHPGVPVVELSSRTGAGLDAWFTLLDAQRASKSGIGAPVSTSMRAL